MTVTTSPRSADLHRGHPAARGLDPLHPPFDHLDPGGPRLFELQHPELLARKPPAATGVKDRHCLG